MNKLLLFLVSVGMGIIIIAGVYLFVPKVEQKKLLSPAVFSVESIERPPEQSLKGKIISLSGEVGWQSRVATESAKIISPQPIQQGEMLQTGDDGNILVQFDEVGKLAIFPKTKIDFVQTLPLNFVTVQNTGSVKYQKMGLVPISVRALHLLIDQSEGEMEVNINKDEGLVIVDVIKGKVTAAYNDLDYLSHVSEVKQSESLLFNDQKRVIKIN